MKSANKVKGEEVKKVTHFFFPNNACVVGFLLSLIRSGLHSRGLWCGCGVAVACPPVAGSCMALAAVRVCMLGEFRGAGAVGCVAVAGAVAGAGAGAVAVAVARTGPMSVALAMTGG